MVEAIIAIEQGSKAIGYKTGELILEDKADKRRFVQLTKNKLLIVGRKTYETLPPSVEKFGNRRVHVVTRNNLIQTEGLLWADRDVIVIGGAMTYELCENFIDLWHITWFNKRISSGALKDMVTYAPDLKDFDLVAEEFLPGMRFSSYRRKKRC